MSFRSFLATNLRRLITPHVNPLGNTVNFLLQQPEVAGPIVVYTLVKSHKEKKKHHFSISAMILGHRSSDFVRDQCADVDCTEERDLSVVMYDLGHGAVGKASYCKAHLARGKSLNPFKV